MYESTNKGLDDFSIWCQSGLGGYGYKAFKFDTVCQLGAKGGLRFLARTGGR